MAEVDCIVVGGGVMGLLTARALAELGQQVVLVERGTVGCEASWAGGGIISPLYPWRNSPAVTALARWSQGFYPRLADELRVQTGIDPEVYTTGLFWLDLPDEGEALAWAAQHDQVLQGVAGERLYQAVPGLGDGYRHALHTAGLANVRNPRLLKALRAALHLHANVRLCEGAEVSGFIVRQGRVLGVRTAEGELHANQVVLAAGAWSALLLAHLGIGLPVEPVKGQMILYKGPPGQLPVMVLAKGRYAIPRRDGHILVGSTLEFEHFDKTPTSSAKTSLQSSAVELLPALARSQVVGHWAGLRPGSPEGIPFIGPVPGFSGLWLNCGHYRNGLVLAPASCRLLVDLMMGGPPIVDAQAYAPTGRISSI
ncbi:MAG: FAD-dependent oxidoreductase [Pseudomonas sp.]|uniref:NAD(P)/FAD-dependent oxidoreductase n=1 Tax=Pseudomonas sp. TaxID=306 RepID=UPI00339496AD